MWQTRCQVQRPSKRITATSDRELISKNAHVTHHHSSVYLTSESNESRQNPARQLVEALTGPRHSSDGQNFFGLDAGQLDPPEEQG